MSWGLWGLHTAAGEQSWPWSPPKRTTTLHRGVGVGHVDKPLPPHLEQALHRAIKTGQPDNEAAFGLLDHIGGVGKYWTASPEVAGHFAENESMYGSKFHVVLSGEHDGQGIDDDWRDGNPEEDEDFDPYLEGEDETRLHTGTPINVHTVRVKQPGSSQWTTLMSDFPHERHAAIEADVAEDLMKLAMPAPAPKGLNFKHHTDDSTIPQGHNLPGAPLVTAHIGDDPKPVGYLEWFYDDDYDYGDTPEEDLAEHGEIRHIQVHPDYRRSSIATEMFDWTKKNVIPELHHSDTLTDEGASWRNHEEFRHGSRHKRSRTAMPSRDAYDYMVMEHKRKTDDIPEQGEFYHGSDHEHQPGDILESARVRGDQDRLDYYEKSVGAPNHADWVWMYNHPAKATRYHKNVYQLEPLDEGPWIWNNYKRDDGSFSPGENDEDFPRLVSPRARVIRKLSPEEYNAAADHLQNFYDQWHAQRTSRTAMPNPLPQGVHFRYHPELMWSPGVTAHYQGQQIGSLEWYDDDHVMVDLGSRRPGEIDRISVHPDHRGNSVATKMFDFAKQYEPRLHHSEQLTEDGRGWSEYEKSRTAARLAAVTQNLVDRLQDEYERWHHQNAYNLSPNPFAGEEDRGPLGHWPHIEQFLWDKYPMAHLGLDMGMEEASATLDGHPPEYLDIDGEKPSYETGPEAHAKYGYDPAEIAAGMVLLHNQSHPLRGDLAQEDQARLNDIAQKRHQMQRDYEQRQVTAMAWQDWAPHIRNDLIDHNYYGGRPCSPGGACANPEKNFSGYWIEHAPQGPGRPRQDSRLSYDHGHDEDGNPYLSIGMLRVHEDHRKDGVAEALMRRLVEDHPGVPIYPGLMTQDGQAFHDRMLEKEPDARGVVTAGLHGELPENITFRHHPAGSEPFPDVIQPSISVTNSFPAVSAWDGDRMVGHLQWIDDHPRKKGQIWDLRVHPDYQRRGVATALFDWTTDHIEPDLQHSNNLSDEGRAFAESEVKRPLAQERYEAWRNGQPMPKRFAMPSYYHYTYDPNFKPDPEMKPWNHFGDPATAGHDGRPVNEKPGLFVSPDPDGWGLIDQGKRPYRVELDGPEAEDKGEDSGSFIPGENLSQYTIKGVTPNQDWIKHHSPEAQMREWNERGKFMAGRNGDPPPMTFEPFNTMWTNGIMARHAHDGRPLAHLHWYPDGEIETIRVHPEMRGRGVGKAILTHAVMNPETYEAQGGIKPSNHLTPEGRAFANSLGHVPSDEEVTPAEGEHDWAWKAVQNYVPMHVPYNGQNEDEMSHYLEQPWEPPARTASVEDEGWPVWWRNRHRPAGPFDKRWHPNHPEHVPAPWAD